jgi:head-tail adaptor
MARGQPYDTRIIVQALVQVRGQAGDLEDKWVDSAPVIGRADPATSQDAARLGQRDWNVLFMLRFPVDPLITAANRPGFPKVPTQLQFLAESAPRTGVFNRVFTYKGGPLIQGAGYPVLYYGDQIGVRQQAPHG